MKLLTLLALVIFFAGVVILARFDRWFGTHLIIENNSRTGKAAWYGENYRGAIMANGEPFDPDKLTCATYFWPLGTWLCVRYHRRDVLVLVTDRGPDRGPDRHLGRLLDLSRAAFARIADPDLGVVPVSVSVAFAASENAMAT